MKTVRQLKDGRCVVSCFGIDTLTTKLWCDPAIVRLAIKGIAARRNKTGGANQQTKRELRKAIKYWTASDAK